MHTNEANKYISINNKYIIIQLINKYTFNTYIYIYYGNAEKKTL